MTLDIGIRNTEIAARAAEIVRPPMRFQMEADWHLLNTCNYRCTYCFSPPEVLSEKLRTYASFEAWEIAFSETGLTWLLHLTGGEPTIYPEFTDFCEALTEKHFISFNSNLSRDTLNDFPRRVDPARVSFINAGFHPAERGLKQGIPQFLKNVDMFASAGFRIFVSVVATPSVLPVIYEIAEVLHPTGMVPVPKMLRGTYEGREYPDAYTSDERKMFQEASLRAQAAHGALAGTRDDGPTVNPFFDDGFLNGLPDYVGRSCEAGQRFVSIGPDGTVYRCSHKTPLGNLLMGTFRPAKRAAPCDTKYCFYFCEKYSEPEVRTSWLGRLGLSGGRKRIDERIGAP